jgi:hypothetical protein
MFQQWTRWQGKPVEDDGPLAPVPDTAPAEG